MNRRAAVLGVAALGAAMLSRHAYAQAAGRVWRVGYLGPSAETAPRLLKAFQEGLAAVGYQEGRNLVVEYRWTNAGTAMNDEATLLASARDLVALKVDVIAASIDPAILAASKATSVIPIVMLNVSDPIALGLVAHLPRPGGNVTGLTRLSPELVGKNLQILLEVIPRAKRIGLLANSIDPARPVIRNAERAAEARGISLQLVEVLTADGFDEAFATLKRGGAEGLLVADTGNGIFFTQRARLAALAVAQRLPAIYANTEIVEAGGLMSYSPPASDNYRRAGAIIDKILRGTKAGEIAVEQPTTFELVINMKTAKAMQVVIPQSVLLRADRRIGDG